MVKIRLHGVPEEVERFKVYLETLSPQVKVLCGSGNYPDRGKSEYVRAYLDVELGTPAKVNADFEELFKKAESDGNYNPLVDDVQG